MISFTPTRYTEPFTLASDGSFISPKKGEFRKPLTEAECSNVCFDFMRVFAEKDLRHPMLSFVNKYGLLFPESETEKNDFDTYVWLMLDGDAPWRLHDYYDFKGKGKMPAEWDREISAPFYSKLVFENENELPKLVIEHACLYDFMLFQLQKIYAGEIKTRLCENEDCKNLMLISHKSNWPQKEKGNVWHPNRIYQKNAECCSLSCKNHKRVLEKEKLNAKKKGQK